MEARARNPNGTFQKGAYDPTRARRVKGEANKITRDIKNGCIEGFAAHGLDGKGKLGFPGYIQFLAGKHPKAAVRIIEKLLPLQVNGQGFGHSAIGSVNIVSIPSGVHLTRSELAQLQNPTPHVIDHVPQQETPALEPIEAPTPEPAAIDQEFTPQTERERQLLTELEALSPEELLERAKQVGYFDVADGN